MNRISIMMLSGTIVGLVVALSAVGQDSKTKELPLVFEEDFEKGAARWEPTDPAAWKVIDTKTGKAYSQFQQSNYKPPTRSPFNLAIVKDLYVSDFVLEAKCQSTVKDYGHRDM